MLLPITNTPRDYPWGSRTAIAELTGRAPSGRPEAELWLGAHPLGPSVVVDPSTADGHATLDAWITTRPERALGTARTSDELPFLMKIVAAETPLSIQTHPDAAQARRGFDEENRRHIPLTSPARVYKDRRHKPELAFALSDTFEALIGFRAVGPTRRLVAELARNSRRPDLPGRDRLGDLVRPLDAAVEPEPVLRHLVGQFLLGGQAARELAAFVAAAAGNAPRGGAFDPELDTLVELAAHRPGDPGLLVALLLNRVTLRAGQAVYVPPGTLHAYLRGTAIEVMAASDNVVRGGLTDKHVDVHELQRLTTFRAAPARILAPERPSPGTEFFAPDLPDFTLTVITVPALSTADDAAGPRGIGLTGPAIAFALEGEVAVAGEHQSTVLSAGESLFITPDERTLTFTGAGRIALAGTRLRRSSASPGAARSTASATSPLTT